MNTIASSVFLLHQLCPTKGLYSIDTSQVCERKKIIFRYFYNRSYYLCRKTLTLLKLLSILGLTMKLFALLWLIVYGRCRENGRIDSCTGELTVDCICAKMEVKSTPGAKGQKVEICNHNTQYPKV